MEFSGRLASVSLADLLQWASNDRRTGSLVVRTTRRQKRVFFAEGKVVGCHSDDPAEYFGQYLLLEGYLDQYQLMETLTWCRENRRRLGAALVEQGLLPADRVQRALTRQIEETICDLFLWSHGVFYFEHSIPREEELLPHPIDAMALVMEGSRWADEHDRIRRVFVHDNVVLRRGPEWPSQADDARQQRIMDLFTDGLSLGDLYGQVRGSHYRFLEATFDLTVREILDIDSVGDEIRGRTSAEIRILDLLMEQAAEEEVLFAGRHLSLPVETFDRFYPVWIEVEEDIVDMDADNLELCRAMDGSKSIHTLVVSPGQGRERRMEMILNELRKGNLVLLPRPLSELGGGAKTAWLKRLFG